MPAPSSGRSSGPARSTGVESTSGRSSRRSCKRASSAASGARRWPARSSSPSRTRSSATSRTGSSREPSAPPGIEASPNGSSRSVATRTTRKCVAYHWRSALDLGRAAGNDDGELAERARLALREAGDRASGLNAFAVAAKYYEDALALSPPDDPDRPTLLFAFARALTVAADERRIPALEAARDALLVAGDRERAAESEASLAEIAWYQGRQDDVFRSPGSGGGARRGCRTVAGRRPRARDIGAIPAARWAARRRAPAGECGSGDRDRARPRRGARARDDHDRRREVLPR